MVSTPLRDAVWSWRASSSLSVAVSCHALGCPTVSGPWDNLKHRAACRHDGIGTHGGGAIVQHATCAWPQVRGVPYFFQNTSTRPVVSTVVCRPVQNGWQLEHTVTRMLGTVERVCTVAPQVHVISVSMDAGWCEFFIEPPLMAAFSAWYVCYVAAATRARGFSVKTCV